MFRPGAASFAAVVFSVLVLAACSFSNLRDITPPAGSEFSAEGTSFLVNETPVFDTNQAATQPGPAAIATGKVVFTGKVANGSGGQIPKGLRVELQGYRDMENILTLTTFLTEGSTFEFPPVDVAEGEMYILAVEYQGVTFSSGIIDSSALASAETWPVDLIIYENTTDPDDVYIDLCHIFISSLSREKIQIVVYLLISNDTQRVVTAVKGAPVLSFTLPGDAANLQLVDSGNDSRFVILDNGFGDTLDILPGTQVNEILYSFELPYDGKRDLSFDFPVPDETGMLIVPEGLHVSGGNLIDAGEREMDGNTVQLYTYSFLPANEPLTIQLSGRQKGTSVVSSLSVMLVGLGVLVIVITLIILWLRKRSKVKSIPEAPAVKLPLLQTREAVLDAIIALDMDFEEGILSEEEYTLRREQLKSKLKDIREK